MMKMGIPVNSGCELGMIALTCACFPFFPDFGLYFLKEGKEGVSEGGREEERKKRIHRK